MKWGVRRTREQLKYDKGSIESILRKNALKTATKNGILVSGISEHALKRSDKSDRAVTSEEILSALKTPLHINDVRVDPNGLRSQRFIGKDATVNINPDSGLITTVWKTGSDKLRKHLKKGK